MGLLLLGIVAVLLVMTVITWFVLYQLIKQREQLLLRLDDAERRLSLIGQAVLRYRFVRRRLPTAPIAASVAAKKQQGPFKVAKLLRVELLTSINPPMLGCYELYWCRQGST
jgi:type II secretory pathway pseudopilin PulG